MKIGQNKDNMAIQVTLLMSFLHYKTEEKEKK